VAPAEITEDGRVSIPLDEHTRAIAEAAAVKAVQEHMATCPIMHEFRAMHTDMYGIDGEKEVHPGVMGHVSDLLRSRKFARAGLWGLWTVVSSAPVIAWLISHFTRSNHP